MIESPARPTVTAVAVPAETRPQRSEARRLLTAASGALVAFLALAGLVSAGWTTGVDGIGRPLSTWATAQGLDPLLVHVEVVFGREAMTICAVVLVLALLAARAWRLAVFAAVVTFGTAYATDAVKDLLGRARPGWQLAEHHHDTFAFPSGHASSITALVGVLAVVTWVRAAHHPAQRTVTSLVTGVGIGIVVVIAADRVLLGRHYPTDVIGGALLATVVVLVSSVALGLVGHDPATASADVERNDHEGLALRG